MYVFVMASVLLLLSILEYQNKLDKRLINVVFGLLCLFFVCRYTYGTDLPAYQSYFSRCIDNTIFKDEIVSRSPIYILINLIAAKTTGSYDFFVLLLNIANTSLIGYTIYKNSNNICMSLFLWVTCGISQVYMMSGLRQGLAMSIFFFGYFNYLDKDKYVKYLVCAVLSILCHETALIAFMTLIVRLLVNKFTWMKDKRLLGALLILAVLATIFTPDILKALTPYLGHVGSYTKSWVLIPSAISLRIVLMLGVYTIYYFVKDEEKYKYSHSVYMYYIIFIIYLAFCGMDSMARFSDYYAIIEIILMANMFKDLKKVDNKYQHTFMWMVIIGYILVNYTMCYADIVFHMDTIKGTTFMTYPYIPLFCFPS